MTLVLILALASLVFCGALFAAVLADKGEAIHILALTLCSAWTGFILGRVSS